MLKPSLVIEGLCGVARAETEPCTTLTRYDQVDGTGPVVQQGVIKCCRLAVGRRGEGGRIILEYRAVTGPCTT